MILQDALQEYIDNCEIWAQRAGDGLFKSYSPCKIVPNHGDPTIDLENYSYVCPADHSRDEILQLSATWSIDDKDEALYYLNFF